MKVKGGIPPVNTLVFGRLNRIWRTEIGIIYGEKLYQKLVNKYL